MMMMKIMMPMRVSMLPPARVAVVSVAAMPSQHCNAGANFCNFAEFLAFSGLYVLHFDFNRKVRQRCQLMPFACACLPW
jgi:hypothetical protein